MVVRGAGCSGRLRASWAARATQFKICVGFRWFLNRFPTKTYTDYCVDEPSSAHTGCSAPARTGNSPYARASSSASARTGSSASARASSSPSARIAPARPGSGGTFSLRPVCAGTPWTRWHLLAGAVSQLACSVPPSPSKRNYCRFSLVFGRISNENLQFFDVSRGLRNTTCR